MCCKRDSLWVFCPQCISSTETDARPPLLLLLLFLPHASRFLDVTDDVRFTASRGFVHQLQLENPLTQLRTWSETRGQFDTTHRRRLGVWEKLIYKPRFLTRRTLNQG